jgi:hypothetical protein
MPKEPLAIKIVETAPCLICGCLLTQIDIDSQRVIGAGSPENLQVACLSHFFTCDAGAWASTADCAANLALLVRAARIANPTAGPEISGLTYKPGGKIEGD